MKITKLILFILIAVLGILLSACAGGAAATNTSWPGVTISPDQKTAYVAYRTHVYAVNLDNGSQIWRFPAETDNNITFYAPPALTGDGQLIVGGYDNLLYSLNPENGQQNWVFDGSTNRLIGGPLAGDPHIYAPSSDASLYALDLAGNLQWSFSTDDALWATPANNGKNIYLPSMDQRVYALQAENGQVIWKTEPLGGSIASTPTLSPEGVLFLGTVGSEVLALDTQNAGEVLWRTSVEGWAWAAPLLEGDTLYAGTLAGVMYAMDAQTGNIRWQIQPDQEAKRAISDRPLVVDGTLYFGSESGFLFAVDAETGNPRWNKEIGGRLYARPQAVGDAILVAPDAFDQLLILLDQNGNQRWGFTPPK